MLEGAIISPGLGMPQDAPGGPRGSVRLAFPVSSWPASRQALKKGKMYECEHRDFTQYNSVLPQVSCRHQI